MSSTWLQRHVAARVTVAARRGPDGHAADFGPSRPGGSPARPTANGRTPDAPDAPNRGAGPTTTLSSWS